MPGRVSPRRAAGERSARPRALRYERILCFFFQAEDGIRDYKVTGVQTCALPILPLHWGEVDQSLDPRNFTIKNALRRMETLGSDPCAPALTTVPDLPAILGRLSIDRKSVV